MLILLFASPAAAQQLVSRHSFESPVAGPEWSVRQVNTTPTGRRFLGQFANDDTVDLRLTLPAGTSSITLSFDLVVIGSWDGNGDGCACGSDQWGMKIDGVSRMETTFSNTATLNNHQQQDAGYPGTVGSNNPARTGAFEADTLGYFSHGDSVYHIVVRQPIGPGTHTVSFFGRGLGDLGDESWGLDNVEVRAAVGHTLAAWGRNDLGQLGDGTTINRATPVTARLADGSALANVIAVEGGYRHTLALRADGTVWASGENFNGQIGDGTKVGKLNPVQVRLADGSPVTAVVAIAAGIVHSVALRSDGSVWTWGWNVSGQLGDGTTTQRLNPVQAQFPDGSPLGGIVAVTAGNFSTVALRTDGTLWVWGDNFAGQLGDGTSTNRLNPVQARWTDGSPVSGMVSISAGGSHTVALRSDGTVWAWGSNFSGQLGDGTTTARITPVLVGQVGGIGLMTDAVAIATGMFHSLAIVDDGSVWAWGHNASGQIGNGTTSPSLTPTPVSLADGTMLMGAIELTAGEPQTIALLADGTAWTWGSNQYGQLGDGTFTDRLNPVQVSLAQGGFASGAGIGSGRYHSFSTAALAPATSLTPATLDFGDVPLDSTSISRSVTLTNSSTLDLSIQSVEIPDAPTPFVISGSTCSDASLTPGASCTIDVTLTPPEVGPLSATLQISTTGIGSPHTVPLIGSGVSLLSIFVSPVTNATEGAPFIVTGFVSVDGVRQLIRLDISVNNDDTSYQTVPFGANNTFSFAHQYADNRQFGIRLVATDDHGWATTRLVIIPVENVAPAIAPIGKQNAQVGATFALVGAFVDPGGDDSWIGTIDYGDGTLESIDIVPAERSFRTRRHTYGAAGVHTATITVTDDDGGVGTLQVAVSVARSSTMTVLTVPPGGSRLGQVVRLIADVSGSNGGTVEFFDGSVRLGASTFTAGTIQASLLVGTLRLGPHELSAHYQGSTHSEPSTSRAESHVVTAASGAVRAWGLNHWGQLGDGTLAANPVPLQVQGLLDNVVATAAGEAHSLGLKADGTVWAWGGDFSGQLGVGRGAAQPAPQTEAVQVATLSDVVAIAAGQIHSLALKADGTVWAWGDNSHGQLGTGTQLHEFSPKQVFGFGTIAAAAIAAGGSHSVMLRADGTVFVWGENSGNTLGLNTALSSVLSPTAITSGLPVGLIVEISAGYLHTLARDISGDVYAWGRNESGQLGDGTRNDRPLPVPTGVHGASAISAGLDHGLALLSGGAVRAWGSNSRGQLGTGSFENSFSPVDPGLSQIVALAAGFEDSRALKSDGSVWAWGANARGQLGGGTLSDRDRPTVAQITGAVALASGSMAWHGLAISPLTTAAFLPASVSFGSQLVGTSSPAQTVSVTNTGLLPLSVRPILTGGETDYAVSREDCSMIEVPPGGSCTVDVIFSPAATTGVRPGSLLLVANIAAPTLMALTGTAITDAAPPVTTATITPAPISAGWHNAAILASTNGVVTVTLDTTDEPGGSGVSTITYSVNGAGPIVASGSSAVITVVAQGITVITYRAVDNEGNVESGKALTLNIDTAAPTVSATSPTAGAEYPLDQLVLADFACSDAGSGMVLCLGNWSNGQAIFTGFPGVYTFLVRVTDLAGNTNLFPVPYTVAQASASVTLATDRPTSTVGEVVRFTATVAAPAGVARRPAGTVTFFSDGDPIGAVAVAPTDPAIAVLRLANVPAGSHTITAKYSGDGYFAGAAAEPIRQEVAPQPRPYAVRDVGSLGGSETSAYGVNSSGQVAGLSSLANGSSHAFLFAGGSLVDLGTLAGGDFSFARGLNDAGVVVGFSRPNGWVPRAFVFANETMTDLGTLGGTFAQAIAINAGGRIVGSATVSGDAAQRAFAYENGSMTDLGTLGGIHSSATNINEAGDIVGHSDVNTFATGCQTPSSHAFVRRAGGMTDLGTLGGCHSFASDINAAGEIVGYSQIAPGSFIQHAFVYRNGVMTDLGTLGGPESYAMAINNHGDVVGYSSTSNGELRAFLYRNGVMTDLNALLPAGSGWAIPYAFDINDSGTIAGQGTFEKRNRGFILLPALPTMLAVSPASGGYGGTATVMATLTAGGSPIGNVKVSFDVDGDGNLEHSVQTDGAGVATVLGASLDGLSAGTYSRRITASFAGNEEYPASIAAGDLTVTKAVPQITWAEPASIVSGTALDAQLNARANVPGTFTYTPEAGTLLNAGTHPLAVTFTPTDATNYETGSRTVLLTVTPSLAVAVVGPNGGEKVFNGVLTIARWTVSSAALVDVELSRNGGTSFVPIPGCTGLPGAATSCSWTPSGSSTTNARIRVTARDAATGVVTDASDAAFTISTAVPAITVTSPNTAVSWTIGTTKNIAWSHNLGVSSFVRVELSRDAGASWEVLAGSLPNAAVGSGSFVWIVSGPAAVSLLVRIAAVDTPASDVSNVPFAIASPSVRVTAPNTGGSWQIGDTRNVGFSHNLGAGFDVEIDVSRDAGSTWSRIETVTTSTSATVSYPWLVTGPPSAQALIRVGLAAQPAVSDTADVTFTLTPSVKVTAPNIAVTWGAGSMRTVSWTHNLSPAETVNVDFSGNGGVSWLPLSLGVANATATTGTAAVALPPLTTSQGVIRVSPTARPADGDVNDAPITLVAPSLSVTAPNTNVNWTAGTVRSIKWNHNLGVRESVQIELSRDGGTTWETLAVDVANTANMSGTFDWTVAGPATASARVRLTWTADTRVQDTSDVSFRIQ
jgi:probable HAF family extracellular repeat protein